MTTQVSGWRRVRVGVSLAATCVSAMATAAIPLGAAAAKGAGIVGLVVSNAAAPQPVEGSAHGALTSADPATAYQLNSAHTGAAGAGEVLGPAMKLRWSITLGTGSVSNSAGETNVISYPIIAGGRVFVTITENNGSYGTTLYALDALSGKVLWRRALGGTYDVGDLTYDGGTLFAENFDGLVRALSPATGAVLWRTIVAEASNDPPTASGGYVYTDGYGNNYGEVDALAEASGRRAWATSGLWYGEGASPAVSAGSVYVSYACEQAYALGATSGTLLWHHGTTCSGGGGLTAAVADSRVFVRDPSYTFAPAELSTATGKGLSIYTARYIPAIDGATAFVQTATDGALQAVNITTGTMKWSFAGDGLLSGPPLVADGMVISQSHSGRIYVLAEASGSVLETLRTAAPVQVPNEAAAVSESGTAVGNGLYVAADIAGILYAYSN